MPLSVPLYILFALRLVVALVTPVDKTMSFWCVGAKVVAKD